MQTKKYRTHIDKNCEECGTTFSVRISEHKRGNGKYCSKSCSRISVAKKNTKTRVNNCVCAACQKPFFKLLSRWKQAKHGHHFCSRVCKERAHTIGDPHFIEEIAPDHYNDGGQAKYRERALRHHGGACQECGYDKVPEVLHVHHRDRNRKNNVMENLQVLCPTCHAVEHFNHRDGWWAAGKDGGP